MSTLDIVASVLLVLGSLMSLLAGIAVLRFPDTMSRIHAATKPQVLGIILLMVGVGLRLGSLGQPRRRSRRHLALHRCQRRRTVCGQA